MNGWLTWARTGVFICLGGANLMCAGQAQGIYRAAIVGEDGAVEEVTDAFPQSVMGEPRLSKAVLEGRVRRFHEGVDLPKSKGFDDRVRVAAIEPGIVVDFGGSIGNRFILVRSTGTDPARAFRYVHVIPDVGLGPVDAGRSLGRIETPSGGIAHLHFEEKEIRESGTFDVNPLRAGALAFRDTNDPEFVPVTIKGRVERAGNAEGSVTGAIVPIRYGVSGTSILRFPTTRVSRRLPPLQ